MLEPLAGAGLDPWLHVSVPFPLMASFLRVVGIICDIFLLLVTPILVAIFAVAARKREALSFTLRGWLRFPVALVLTALCEFALGAIYLSVNPFVSAH